MKKLLVMLLVVAVFAVFTSCGEDSTSNVSSVSPTATIKENLDIDSYVNRYIEIEKDDKDGKEPEVTVTEGRKSNTTKLTYDDNISIELYSNPETKNISEPNLIVKTKEPNKKELFYEYVEKMMRSTDPTLTDEQVADTIKIFRESEPKENGTGISTRSQKLNNVVYAVFYYDNEGQYELIIS